jgi:hypothetical protein
MPLYGGPYKIIAKLHPNTYQIAAGSLNRLQMKIKGDAPKALFTHCCAHRLNLVLQNLVTKSWPVTAPGSQGVFRGRGRGFGFLKNGRQAAIVLSWLLLVQLPGQVLRSYSSKVSKSKRFLIVKQILVYSVTAKLSTEQYLVVRYWFTRMR